MPGCAVQEIELEMSKQDNEPKEVPIELSDNEEESVASDDTLAPDDPPESDDPPAEAEGDSDRLAALQAQIDALTQERSMLLDQRLRTQAEFENYRRRVDRERAETYAR